MENEQFHVVQSGLWIEQYTVGPASSSLVAPPRDTVHEPDLRLGCRNRKHGNPLSQVVSTNLTVMIKAGVGLCVHGLLQSRDSHRWNDVICSKSY